MTTSAERKKSRPFSGPANVIVAIGPIFLKPCPIARATGPTAKVRVFATNGGALTSQGAPPLDIFHPTRQKRALGTPDRAEPLGWLDQHLLARFARLARYAVAQRVQNSRFGPHNGLSPGRGTSATRARFSAWRAASEPPAAASRTGGVHNSSHPRGSGALRRTP